MNDVCYKMVLVCFAFDVDILDIEFHECCWKRRILLAFGRIESSFKTAILQNDPAQNRLNVAPAQTVNNTAQEETVNNTANGLPCSTSCHYSTVTHTYSHNNISQGRQG